MRDHYDDISDWGTYKSPPRAMPLLLLVRLGLGRGLVRRWLLRKWKREFPSLVDVCLNGICYRLDIGCNATDAKLLASSKCYDKRELAFLANACRYPDSVFVDIGANTGYYALSVADKVGGNVLAVEPNPMALKRLRYNLRCNKKIAGKVVVVPVCVGDYGRVPLYANDNLGAASTVIRSGDTNSIWVDSLPLIEVLRQHGIARIDALKIDIEGAEDVALMPFFETAPSTVWPKALIIEYCHRHMWRSDLIDYMRQVGYEMSLKTRSNVGLTRVCQNCADKKRSWYFPRG